MGENEITVYRRIIQMNILVINAGSSSLKYQLMDPETGVVTAKGLCERIGLDGRLTHKVPAQDKKVEREIPMPTHAEAIAAVLEILVDPVNGVIASTDEIDAVGHRVLHGGDKFIDSCIINEACKQAIRDCIPLGPLHNPANLMGIEACEKVMPGKPQVAVFDTAFHMTMPPKAYRYAIPTQYYEEDHLRRYGFHGTSHKYVTRRAIALMGREDIKLVNCHLGNGSSLSAVKDGKCQDPSMGLSPLAGVPMGTRSGDIDACVVQFIMNKYGMSADACLNMLNKKSGVLALSNGVSSDFRDLEAGYSSIHPLLAPMIEDLAAPLAPGEEATLEISPQDYLACLRAAWPVADYIAINFSSPNTPGLRDLQAAEPAARALGGVFFLSSLPGGDVDHPPGKGQNRPALRPGDYLLPARPRDEHPVRPGKGTGFLHLRPGGGGKPALL
mgnify:CR=1 FL=1